jgi:hypothetical protein
MLNYFVPIGLGESFLDDSPADMHTIITVISASNNKQDRKRYIVVWSAPKYAASQIRLSVKISAISAKRSTTSMDTK